MPRLPITVLDANLVGKFKNDFTAGEFDFSVKAGASLSAEFCHGFSLGLDAQAKAQLFGKIEAFLLGIGGDVEASAAAGARALLKLSPEFFKDMGVSVYLGAYARAMARLEIDSFFTLQYILSNLEQEFRELDEYHDLIFDLFIYFLQDVDVGVGVRAGVAYSAMAEAGLKAAFDFTKDKGPSFKVGGGFKVGLKGGASYSFYARAKFKDLRNVLSKSSLRIVPVVKKSILQSNIEAKEIIAEAFDFSFPFLVTTCYDYGVETANRENFDARDKLLDIVVQNFTDNFQRYFNDKFTQIAADLITAQLNELYIFLFKEEPEDKALIKESIEDLIEILERGAYSEEEALKVITLITDIVHGIQPNLLDDFQKPLTILWLSTMLSLRFKKLLDSAFASANTSSSFLGSLGTNTSSNIFENAPELVRQELEEDISEEAAINYLLRECLEYLDELFDSEFSTLKLQFEEKLETHLPGYSFSAFIADVFNVSDNRALEDYKIFPIIEVFIKEYCLEELILNQFFDALEAEHENEYLASYLKEVIDPSLRIGTQFILSKIGDIRISTEEAYLDTILKDMTSGSSVIVYHVLARNFLFFEKLISEYVETNLNSFLNTLQEQTQSDSVFFNDCKEKLTKILPDYVNLDNHVEATRSFLLKLIEAFIYVNGENIYTAERKARIRLLKEELILSMVGSLEKHDNLEDYISALARCNYIPEFEKVKDLSFIHGELITESILYFSKTVLPALGELIFEITYDSLKEQKRALIDLIRSTSEALQNAIDNLVSLIESLDAEIDRLLLAIKEDALALINGIDRLTAPRNDLNGFVNEFHEKTYSYLEPKIGGVPAMLSSTVIAVSVLPLNNIIGVSLDIAVDNLNSIDYILRQLEKFKQHIIRELNKFSDLLSDIENEAIQILNLLIPDHLVLKIKDDKAKLDFTKDEKQAQAIVLAAKEAELENNFLKENIEVEIIAPLANFEFVYPAHFELVLYVKHGDALMLKHAKILHQIHLSKNGVYIPTRESDWQEVQGGLLLRKTISHNQSGIHTLEISAIKSEKEAAFADRQYVQYSVDTKLTSPQVNMDVEFNHDPLGDDVQHEYVKLIYNGSSTLSIKDWILRDLAGHKYQFGDVVLKPAHTITIYTGGNPSEDKIRKNRKHKIVHMGRRKAVWNNEGDVLFLGFEGKNFIIKTKF